MDFHALPRRDLQALCKRNGVRANMANAAMADALSALPKVDGIEEYVKQPAAASEPELKAAVAEEAARREKQGSPLPRGRRVTANTSEEVVKPDECKGKEEEKADAKRQSNKEEDATALGVGRRRTSRRAGPAPVAAAPAAEPAAKAAEEKPGNLPPRTRRVPARLDDGVEKEDIKQDAKKEDAPVQGAVRRGPSRRTGAAPVADESAAQPETKAAPQEEEKHGSQLPCARGVTSKPTEPARPDDNAEEEKVKDQEKNNDGVPVQLVGRRGPSRRLRPAPVFLEPEDLWSPPPRGRRVTFNLKSSVPIGTEGSEANEKKDMQREANKGIMAALGVGRRGARGRARPEPAVPEPAGEVAAEQAAPIPRSRRGTGKASESIRVNGNEEENKEELKLDEKEEDVPAQGVARRGPSRRARPVALEPPATRGKEPAISTEAPDVTVEAKLVRPTRARKPAMKAAAVEEEKVPRRTTKKAAATNSTLQNEKQQEEPQETGPALASNEACYDLENVEEAADPHNLEHSKMIDEPKQEDKEVLMNEDDLQMEAILVRPTRVHKPTMKAAVLAEEKVPRRTTKKAAPRKPTLRKQKQQEEPLEAVPAPVSDEARYYLESVEQAADPQNVEQSVVVDEPNQEDKEISEVDMNKDEMLMVETLAEEPPVTHQTLLEESLSEEPPMTDPQNVEQSKLIDEPNQEVKEVEMNKDEILMADTLAEEPLMEESMSEEPPMTDPQNVEQSKVIDEQNQEVKEVGMNEDETLTVVTPAEEPPVIVKILMEESLTEEASMIDPQNLEQSDVIDKPSQDDKEVEMNEILMVEIPAEETPVIDGETKDKLSVEEQQVVVNPCASTLPVLEDSPVMGLVSKFAKQTFEKDEDDGAHAGEELEKDAGEEMEKDTGKMMGTIQTSEGHADNGSEKDEAVVLDYSGKISSVVEEKAEETMVPELVQNEQVIDSEKDEAVVLDYSGKISSVVEEKAEETMVPELVQNEQVIGNNVTQATMIHGEGAGMEKAKPVTGELTQGTTQLDEDVEEDDFQTDFVHVDELKEVVRMDKTETVIDQLPQSVDTMDKDVEEDDGFQTDFTHVDEQKLVADGKKVELVTGKLPQCVATMDKDVEEDDGFQSVTIDEDVEKDFQTDFALGKEQKEITNANWVQEIIMNGDIVVEMQQSTSMTDEDVEEDDGFQTDFTHVDEQKLVADGKKVELVTDKLPQCVATMDKDVEEDDGFQSVTIDEDVEKDFQSDFALGKEQKEITNANWVQEIIMNGDIVVEMQQSTSMTDEDDAVDDQLETDFVLAKKQKDKATADKPKLTGTDGEVDEEDKAIEETEEMPQSIGTMDECIQEGYFQFDFVHADQLKKEVTAENVVELSETEDEDVQNESASTGDLPRELDIARGYTDSITSGLLDDITETLSKITITEPTGSIHENVPICKNNSENTAKTVCKNSSEKNIVEPVFKNKSESKTAEPVAMQENMGAKVAKKSVDLNKLTLGQLRTKLKKTLELKKARVALGRVDGNAHRSNTTEQEHVRKLLQHQPGEEASSEL